ncbi:lipoprotein N-acyltransferase Lnb domain-containing protein [Flavobacterium sp.]|uniref:lipoprotein N-acyltransferase Lnb domain-containing protein n=1 Tax=Flavobacterium sp. TaxID=239 RepID=UPI002FD931EC
MFKFKVSFLVLAFLLLTNTMVFGQMPLSKTAKFSILTCQEGDELYSLFGHTAIRIQDTSNALDVVYNYGTFDFKTENFYLKFIKGDLRYFVSAYSYNEFYYEYTLENRSIYEQPLNLTAAQKQQLFDVLNTSLQSDEKYYTYKFIDRNCTNMVVDKVNQTLGQNCIVKTTEKDESYRQILFPYLANHFFENLGINIIFGKKTDEKGEKLFLPNQFMESLKVAKCHGKPISGAPKTILKATPTATGKSLWNNFYVFCLVLFLFVIARKAWVYLVYFGILGLLGVFLTAVGLYSSHDELAYNYNLLLFNPLLLLLIVCYWKKSFIWVKKIAQLSIALLMVLVIVLLNKPNLVMFLPMIISSLIMLFYFLRKSNRALLAAIK